MAAIYTCIKRSILTGIFIVSITSSLPASVSLSVTPFEGGGSLRFGPLDISQSKNKEVRIRINSSDGTRYQVFHRLQESFVNDRGISLSGNAFRGYSVTGSNSTGTMYQQSIEPVTFGDDLIYTSDQNGNADSFIMVYQIDPSRMNVSGRFLGKLLFTVRPIGSGAQQETVLNVFLDAYGNLKFQASGSAGHDRIDLNIPDEGERPGYLKISFDGNTGDEIQIFQDIRELPLDENNNEICRGCLQYRVMNAGGESLSTGWQELKHGRKFLISSDAVGDEMLIEFRVDPKKELSAGQYRARLDYEVESAQINRVFPFDLTVLVSPVFEIDIQYPEGGMNFSGLLPESPPQVKEVDVKIRSNLGRPYMVTQSVVSPLTNEEGEVLPSKYFRLKQTLLGESRGKVEYPGFDTIKEGEYPIYFSDSSGSPAQFKAQYELRSFTGIEPGNYSTQITYSLGQK